MSLHIVKQFARDTGELLLPDAIGTGVTSGRGGQWGWVELPGRSTDEVGTTDLIQLTATGANDLRYLIPAGAEFHFLIQWGLHSGDAYRADELRSDMTDGQANYVELGARRIEDNRFPQRQVLLGVDFSRDSSGRGVVGRIHKLTGTATPAADATQELAERIDRVRSWHDRMAASSFEATPAFAEQIAWSISRSLHRGVSWLPTGDLISAGQMLRLRSADVRPGGMTHVEVHTPAGIKYLKLLIPSERGFPATEMELPGGEWLKELSIADLVHEDRGTTGPVEVSIRGRNIPQQEAVKRLRDALAMVKDQRRSAAKGIAGDPASEVNEAGEILQARLDEVLKGQVGMIEDQVTWIVEGDSVKEVTARAQRVIDHYAGKGITIWCPPAIQDLLWQQTLIGDRRRVKEFDQFRPWSTLIGAWFHGGSVVGADTGPYLAANIGSTPGPFLNRLSDAQLAGDPITTAFVGKSGSGKSTGVMLSLLGELAAGDSWGLLADVKGDLGGIVTAAELFGIPTTMISTSEAASGALCPFRFIPDPQEAAGFAVDNLSMMVDPKNHSGVEAHIRRAANRVANYDPDQRPRSTNAVITELLADEHPDARSIGAELQELAQDPLTRPITGKPDLTARPLPTSAGLVYMMFDNLRWPGKETARLDWKPGHRLSMMLLQAGLAYAMFMAARVKGLAKIVALTELHRYAGYDFGRDSVSDLALMGRANDVNQLLDTQEANVILGIPGLADQISTVHAFGVLTPDEADRQAKLLGLMPEPRLRGRQQSWGKGQCLTRDRWGRIAPIQFDYMTSEIENALRTTPERTRSSGPAVVRSADTGPIAEGAMA